MSDIQLPDYPMTGYMEQAMQGWKPSTGGGAQRDLQNAWALTQHQPIPNVEQNTAGLDLMAHLKAQLAGMGEEFQNIPNAVLGQWIKEYLGGDVEAKWQEGGYPPQDFPKPKREEPLFPWNPAASEMQAGINKAGF